MAKFEKGEAIWVASIRYGEVRMSEHVVKSCGAQFVGVTKASDATRYSTRVPLARAHATKRAALEQVLEEATRAVKNTEEQLDEARALLDAVNVELDKA